MQKINISFSTQRLFIHDWLTISSDWKSLNLEDVVMNLLTPKVTQSLPPSWQGTYTAERAKDWIKQRNLEGDTLLVIEKATQQAIGLVILFSTANGKDLRIGYLLSESTWGNGFATELIQGLVAWSQKHDVSSLTGGVEIGNYASKRVLEKNNFVLDSTLSQSNEDMFVWKNKL